MSDFNQPYRYCDEIAVAVAIDPKVVTRGKNISVAVELHGSMTRLILSICFNSQILEVS
jgi:inosine-uridine nucleoside N-ribohydrolase